MTMLRPAILLFILLSLITGGLYPLMTTALGQWWFQDQANGSLIIQNGENRGSRLIGQNFTDPRYFRDALPPLRKARIIQWPPAAAIWRAVTLTSDKAIAERVAALRAANPQASREVPVELVTASASGLDYSLTPDAVVWQIPRVAAARQLTVEQVSQLVAEHTQKAAGQLHRHAGSEHC